MECLSSERMHRNGQRSQLHCSPRKSQLSEWGIYEAQWGFGSVINAPYVGEIGCDKSPPCPHIARGGGGGASH